MGSNFFQKAINPAGAIFGNNSILGKIGGSMTEGPAAFAGPNSFIAKESHYDPLMGSSAGAYINPAAHAAGVAYGNRLNVGSTPTPFAGVTPTLADANAGYVQRQSAPPTGMITPSAGPQQRTPLPWMSGNTNSLYQG